MLDKFRPVRDNRDIGVNEKAVGHGTYVLLPTAAEHRTQITTISRTLFSTSMMESSSLDFRLPLNVQPTHYDLTVKTDLQKQTFEGLVKIR